MTIQTLEGPAGGSLYVRDFALELFHQGHHPYIYCRRLGAVSSELLNAGIPVVDSIDRLTKPDIIHGNSPIETVAVMLRFSDTPAIFVGHGWQSPDSLPPKLPGIVKYLAVGEPARDALIYFHGIPAHRTALHQNPVDLQRFRRRGPLPTRPERALVLCNSITEANLLGVIQAVCRAEGISLDVVGLGMGTMRLDAENILGGYDLVFGNGRAALEALASGCAVILSHGTGLGELITAENYDILRRRNFGFCTVSPGGGAELLSQIRRYNPADAASVTERVRRSEGLFVATSVLVDHYRDAIKEFPPRLDGDSTADRLAAARFLDRIAPTSNTFFLAETVAPVERRARTAEAKLRLLSGTLGMSPLPAAELSKIQVRLLTAARRIEAGEYGEAVLQVVNGANAVLSSLGDQPVHLSYHWLANGGLANGGLANGGLANGGLANGGLVNGGLVNGDVANGGVANGGLANGGLADGGLNNGRPGDNVAVVLFEGLRSELYPPLPPGASFEYTVRVKAPETAGKYILRLTAVQEGVAWLDQMGVFCEIPVEIGDVAATPVLRTDAEASRSGA